MLYASTYDTPYGINIEYRTSPGLDTAPIQTQFALTQNGARILIEKMHALYNPKPQQQ